MQHPQHGFTILVIRRRRKNPEGDIRELGKSSGRMHAITSGELTHRSSNKMNLFLPLVKVLREHLIRDHNNRVPEKVNTNVESLVCPSYPSLWTFSSLSTTLFCHQVKDVWRSFLDCPFPYADTIIVPSRSNIASLEFVVGVRLTPYKHVFLGPRGFNH